MDKRKTQRILGILVIIALIIILFPLLFSKNEVATQTTSVTAPVFPDKLNSSTVVTSNDNQDTPESVPVTPNDNEMVADTKQETITPIATTDTAQTPTESSITPAVPTAAEVKQPLELNTASSDQVDIPKPLIEEAPHKEPIVSSTEKTQPPRKPVTHKHTIKSSKKQTHHKPIVHEVAKLNKQAWIVQTGSFKNKENARSLTDKLRAAGYNAFMREMKTAKGTIRTHVFVGPEFKEASATKISLKIQHDMNLQSIVLPYNPLAL